MPPLRKVENRTKTCGRRVGCANVSFKLYSGVVLGIVGESGSGKMTLLNCMAGQLAPDRGQVISDTRVDGPKNTLTMSEAERRILSRTDWAFVHHPPDGLGMPVRAGGHVGERLMAVGARHYAAIREQALDWLQRVDISDDRIDDHPAAYSGGMQHRRQIARNLVTGPRLVFMDEPTGGLDVSVQARLPDEPTASLDPTDRETVLTLIEEAKAAGAVIVGIFHDKGVRAQVADREIDVWVFGGAAA